MQFRRTLKVVIAGLLVLASAFAMFGCSGKNDSQADEDGVLPNQLVNMTYYFQQGYRTDWKVKQYDEANNGKMINRDTGLVLELVPVEVISTDADGNVTEYGSEIAGVEYTVYYYKSGNRADANIYMTSTREEMVSWALDPENTGFYFNTNYYIDESRETFLQKGDVEPFTCKYSKLQFSQVSYTFTRDGEEWMGTFYIVTGKQEFFIITYEAKKDLFEQYRDQMLETIGDFRKKGWETAQD